MFHFTKSLLAVATLSLLSAATVEAQEENSITSTEMIQEALDLQLLGCIADERSEWAVIGSADFEGEPWVYRDTITIPGGRLVVEFDDQTLFSYGEALDGTNHDVWAKNLHELKALGMKNMPPPYVAVRRTDDSIVLIRPAADGTCKVGWFLGYF